MMNNAIVKKHKSALTRAKKIGPEKVIEVCDAALDDFEDNGYPDCWHLWKMAKYDAETELLRQNWKNSWKLDALEIEGFFRPIVNREESLGFPLTERK